jgi:hypothetical protein
MDENGDLLAVCHNILTRWKNYLSHLLNVHSASDVIKIKIHKVKLSVPDPRHFEVEIAIATFKRYKLPGSVQRSRGTNCQVVIKLWQN